MFKAMVKFFLRNYNASVAAAINRRGYLSNTATITGYRFQAEGNVIKYHETIALVSSCIAYTDYYSSRTDSENGADGIRLSSIDKTVASLLGEFDEDSSAGDSKGKTRKDEDMFLKAFAADLLGDDEDEDDYEGASSPSPTPLSLP